MEVESDRYAVPIEIALYSGSVESLSSVYPIEAARCEPKPLFRHATLRLRRTPHRSSRSSDEDDGADDGVPQ